MTNPWLPWTLRNLYQEAIDVLEAAVRGCPDELWGASLWEVRETDRHVWPVVRGLGDDLPDRDRLQLHSAFWNVAYHVTFFLDHYLGGGVGSPDPPAPFHGDEQDPHTLPHRVYTRVDLLEYIAHCRSRAESLLATLTDEQLQRPARIGWPFGDLLIRNLIQVNEHAAQLNLFLNLRAGLSDPRWTPSDRWFRRCPDCPDPAG
jgi:hypothetical protein